MVAKVRYVLNDSYQQRHETVSGPKDNVHVTVSFDRSSESIRDAQFNVFSITGHAVG